MRFNQLTTQLMNFLKKPINLFIVTIVLVAVWKISRNYKGIGGGKTTMTLFYSPRCGFCKEMMPEWDKFASWNTDDNITVKKVDCIADPQAASDNDIGSYPTIVRDRGVREVYKGERTAEAFQEFAMKK